MGRNRATASRIPAVRWGPRTLVDAATEVHWEAADWTDRPAAAPVMATTAAAAPVAATAAMLHECTSLSPGRCFRTNSRFRRSIAHCSRESVESNLALQGPYRARSTGSRRYKRGKRTL